jgi:MFS family permease
MLALGLAAPVVGRMLDAGRARTMMAAGALVTGIGLLLLSQAATLWHAAVAFIGFVCLGSAFYGTVPSMTLVTNWFERRRGLALGFAVAGATFASYLAPSGAQALIDAFGWRMAVGLFGVATLVVAVPLFAGFVVGRPEQVGQRPDGDPADAGGRAEGASAAGAVPGSDAIPGMLPTGVLARDGRLWLLAFGFGAVMTSPVVLMGLLVEFGHDLGFDAYHTAQFFLVMIPFSLLGKLVVGGLADVAPLKPSIVMTVLVNMAIWGIFSLEPGYPAFLATGALYGLGIGGAMPLQGVATAACFGRANFGRANGLGAIVAVPLLAGASALSHLLEGATGSYRTSFLVQAALIAAGGVALGFVRFPKKSRSARDGAGAACKVDRASIG